jgi:hypothetical protein
MASVHNSAGNERSSVPCSVIPLAQAEHRLQQQQTSFLTQHVVCLSRGTSSSSMYHEVTVATQMIVFFQSIVCCLSHHVGVRRASGTIYGLVTCVL